MHYHATVVLAALSSVAFARPGKQGKNFSLPQIATGGRVAPPAVQVKRTHQKYGVKVPPHVVLAATKQKASAKLTTSVTNKPYSGDLEYLVPVTIAGTTFNLNFDTGSSDLWTYSTLQPSAQQSGHRVYNPSKSGKAISGETWSISYGDGSGASGKVYADKVTVGAITATSQAVEAATSVSSGFLTDTDSDGIVGLAFQSINSASPKTVTPFFNTIASSLSSKLFTAYIKHNAPGAYDFGYINASRYSGNIGYTNVVSGSSGYSYWTLNTLTGFQVGSGSKNTAGGLGQSIVDTGTTLLYLPDSVVKAYYAAVSGSSNSASEGGWIFPCSAKLPNLNLYIAGVWYSIPGSLINYAVTPDNTATCFGGLQSSSGIGMNILGDVFLKAIFVVFDQSQSTPRLGFAQQK